MKHWKQLHRILGTILAPLFVLWLISGSVMIFSSYPRLGDAADRVADTIPAVSYTHLTLPTTPYV